MKNKTSIVTKKEGARKETVRRAIKARFAHRSTDKIKIKLNLKLLQKAILRGKNLLSEMWVRVKK